MCRASSFARWKWRNSAPVVGLTEKRCATCKSRTALACAGPITAIPGNCPLPVLRRGRARSYRHLILTLIALHPEVRSRKPAIYGGWNEKVGYDREVTPVRLLALLEANSVTGPSKNLFQFACCARSGQAGPPVEVAIALFLREGVENLCMEAARQAGPVYPITEKRRFDFGVIPQLRAAIREFQARTSFRAMPSNRIFWFARRGSTPPRRGSPFTTAIPGRTCACACTTNWTAGRCAPPTRF